MNRFDKIKSYVAVVLIAAVVSFFVLLGKDHNVTRWAAAGGMILWVAIMLWSNHLKKK